MPMKPILALALILALSACGVDGPPVPPPDEPEEEERRSGITISGSVGVGVTGGTTRIRSSTSRETRD